MIKSYGDHNWQQLAKSYAGVEPGFIPRRSRYGDDLAVNKMGLLPVGDLTEILQWDDLKDAILLAREHRDMPIFHQYASWAPKGEFRSNQDGLPYCWTWSLTATFLDLRATEQKDLIYLSPVSMGWLVNWASRGYYLDDSIRGLRERGVAPISHVDDNFNSTNRNYRNYKSGWEEEALKYRLKEVWDIDTRSGDRNSILQAATVLCSGRPIYIAYNWWSHALMCTGMRWNEGKKNNIEWEIRNSHNENDVILMDGDRGVPDEMYGFVSSELLT